MQNNDIYHLHKEGFINLHADFDEFLTENNLTFNNNYLYQSNIQSLLKMLDYQLFSFYSFVNLISITWLRAYK